MSKKVIHFSKGFVPCVILSVLLILSGIFVLITKGLNLGIEFKAGLLEDIRIAPTYPPLEDLRIAAELFCLVVKLVSVEKLLQTKTAGQDSCTLC